MSPTQLPPPHIRRDTPLGAANISRRIRILTLVMLAMGAIFIVRLFYIQVIRHDFYVQEASKEHIGKFIIPAKRGEIFAQDGAGKFVPMVLNEPSYTAYADARYVKDRSKVADVLRRIAGGNMVEGFEDGLKDNSRQYVVLARQLNKQQAELLKKEKLVGVGLQEGERRVYPEGQLAAQVLGFVNGEGKGQYGIEEGMDAALSGKPGLLKALTDVNGIPISIGQESVQTPAVDGTDVALSIDRNIQTFTEQALKVGLERVKATRGSVLVINPNNGQVMAMANMPTYNPTNYETTTDYRVFQNAVVSDPYEAGSVTKALSMAIGLNEGVVEPSTTYTNTGSTQVADAVIKNAAHEKLGTVSMTEVLHYSYNTGVVHMLRQLGSGDINLAARQKVYQYFTDRYFLGRHTGIGLAGEARGEIIPPDDPQGGPVRYANMTFGQGLTVTMVQEAAAFASVINGGVYYVPQITSGNLDKTGKLIPTAPNVRKKDVITSATSDKLRTMLREARAPSVLARSDKSGYFIGGKSGTAQVYDSRTGTYSETDTIGSYLGFGGQEKPEYVIMVRVDDAHIGGFAGPVAAGPIFGEISNWLLDYLKIQPKG